MSESKNLKRQLVDALGYIAKLSTPQHFEDRQVGKVTTLKIETQICHQASPSATNYWNDKAFDEALAQVVRGRFPELAEAALKLMDSKYVKARIAEKESLLAALAEIEEMETSAA